MPSAPHIVNSKLQAMIFFLFLSLSASFPFLLILYTTYYRYVTDEGLHELAGHKRPLQSIDLLGCASLNDWSCTALVRSCPTLRTLNVSGCR